MITIQVPSDATVLEAARHAAACHLHLISDGRRTLLSPIVPPGFHELSVEAKPADFCNTRSSETAEPRGFQPSAN